MGNIEVDLSTNAPAVVPTERIYKDLAKTGFPQIESDEMTKRERQRRPRVENNISFHTKKMEDWGKNTLFESKSKIILKEVTMSVSMSNYE